MRLLARLAGKAIAVRFAVLPIQYFPREIHNNICTRRNWFSKVQTTPQGRWDLQWWKTLAAKWNGRQIWKSIARHMLEVDASRVGWSAILDGIHIAHGEWHHNESQFHISRLEMLALMKGHIS